MIFLCCFGVLLLRSISRVQPQHNLAHLNPWEDEKLSFPTEGLSLLRKLLFSENGFWKARSGFTAGSDFFFGCFCCRRNPWFFFVKGIYFGVLQPPGICETAPSHGSRPLRSRWTSPEVFRHLPSAREFGGCVPTLKAPTMPAKAELAAGAGHQGGTTWGVHHLETHCKY